MLLDLVVLKVILIESEVNLLESFFILVRFNLHCLHGEKWMIKVRESFYNFPHGQNDSHFMFSLTIKSIPVMIKPNIFFHPLEMSSLAIWLFYSLPLNIVNLTF